MASSHENSRTRPQSSGYTSRRQRWRNLLPPYPSALLPFPPFLPPSFFPFSPPFCFSSFHSFLFFLFHGPRAWLRRIWQCLPANPPPFPFPQLFFSYTRTHDQRENLISRSRLARKYHRWISRRTLAGKSIVSLIRSGLRPRDDGTFILEKERERKGKSNVYRVNFAENFCYNTTKLKFNQERKKEKRWLWIEISLFIEINFTLYRDYKSEVMRCWKRQSRGWSWSLGNLWCTQSSRSVSLRPSWVSYLRPAHSPSPRYRLSPERFLGLDASLHFG